MTDPDFHACAAAALDPLQRRRRRGRLAQVTEVGDDQPVRRSRIAD
jgi:hypothetical protein